MTTTTKNRLAEVLRTVRAENRAALIGYLPAGFPTVDGSIAAMQAMVEGGCDIIEVGLPYSDPAMDGPVIQAAADKALALGVTTPDVIRAAGAVADTGAAALIMSYWNPIEHYGVDRFAKELRAVGGSGVITPDLIPEEAGPWIAATDEHDIGRVFLVAPSSSDERIDLTARASTGFVYASALMGVTGARDQVGPAAAALVARTRAFTDRPICVGLGVSTGEQAAEVAAYADGVIVGSAFVRRLLDARDLARGVDAVRELAAELAAGVRRGAERRA
jgi:tryptophan synthase alpha chain